MATPESGHDGAARAQLPLRDQLALDRTELANDRTALAVLRTCLGLLVTGGGLTQVVAAPLGWPLGAVVALLALPTAAWGFVRHRAQQRSLEESRAEARAAVLAAAEGDPR